MQDSVKKKPFFYYLSSNTLGTLPSASYFIILTFLLTLLMPPLSGMVVVIFYFFKHLSSLHRRAASLRLRDPSITTETKIRHSGLLRLRENRLFNKAELLLKAH